MFEGDEPRDFTLSLPLYVGGKPFKKNPKRTTKKFYLNLNTYRNAHFNKLNNTKVEFKETMREAILTLPNLTDLWGVIRLDYIYYPSNAISRDVANVVSIIDKYFCDALVELDKLEDDSYHFLKGSSWVFGGIDRNNPRVDVKISPFSGFS